MKKQLIALAAMAALAAPMLAQAQDSGDWIVRGRALHLDSANKGIEGLSVNNKTFPEVDITYFFTPNLAAELILTYPQKHDVRVAGMGKVGTIKHLPPTLSLQYHFTGLQGFRPYVGAGINYTRFSDLDLAVPASADKNSFGFAFGAGVDIPLGGGWLLNADIKKAHIHLGDVNVPALGGNLGTFKVDPVLFSIGVGYRF
ncbi:OmpW/AlkL family protein [Azohydromonas aeria]|uniref:OmpW/AlkL family protein n=1 Tax=Azohydromonas aeria TaxID=2590212 RepID=UPI0012F7E7B2|nr:OmpW family outer membrane protein [Azohydromonas aeria]